LCLLSAILLGEMSRNVALALAEEEALDETLEMEQKHLQTRITSRTRGLQASTEVSRRISTILDTRELTETVVQQIQQAFNYYHVQLYQFTPDKQYLILTAATGTAGQELRRRKHRLATWRGLVGLAGGSGEPQLVDNVHNNPNWLPNELLTETVAELAVPILSGSEIIGVLDIQHNTLGNLDEDSIYVMQTIASQIAVAFQNALLYEQVEAQAQREELLEHISQRIRTATSTEEALKVAAIELTQALNLKRTEIKLGL
ncbi:MAG: GAF domain-containing protein, partial [Anaerolineales bacterium]|nr:GAF domain-containing protein [Anaerolineales bacterium]